MLIRSALISQKLPAHSFGARLYRALDKVSTIAPHCWVRQRLNPWEQALSQAQWWQDEGAQDYHLLHLHGAQSYAFSWSAVSQARCPVIWSISAADVAAKASSRWSLRGFLERRRDKIMAALPQLVIVADSPSTQALWEQSGAVQGQELRVIREAVDTESFRAFSRARAKLERGILPHERVVLFCGEAPRGFLESLRAQFAHEPLHLLCLADKGQRKKQRGHHDRSQMGLSELAALYSAADMIVLHGEGGHMSSVALEAMACGVPLVAQASPALAELVRMSKCGQCYSEGAQMRELCV